MAGTVNKVIIVGNLGKDPEIRSFPNGGRVANFSIATSESWKDKTSGERKERTEWHRVSVQNDILVTVVESYLRKGAKVYIEGQLQTRKWTDKDGAEKYSTEVVLKPFSGVLTMLDSKGGGESEAPAEQSTGGGGQTNDTMDDEIPFLTQFGI